MKYISTLILAVSLSASGALMAAPQVQDGPGQQGPRHADQQGPGQSHDKHGPGDDQHRDGRGPGSGGHYAPGDRLDQGRRGEYVNYRRHHLKAPPRGHQWRKVDNDYVLIAVATGVITSVIAANH